VSFSTRDALGCMERLIGAAITLQTLELVAVRASFRDDGVFAGRVLPDERAGRVGLGYVAAQLVLSYFVAGSVKLRQGAWRDGSALSALLGARQYAPSPSRALRVASGPVAPLASRALVLFECAFPLALCGRPYCLVLMAIGAAFHVVNARVLGLNRFLWAWLAAYPALWFWAAQGS
jgi:hypothetical protein